MYDELVTTGFLSMITFAQPLAQPRLPA